MRALALLALLGACSAAQKPDLVAQSVVLHCQVAAIQPLTLDPENVSAADVKAAMALVKACSATADAGPAH